MTGTAQLGPRHVASNAMRTGQIAWAMRMQEIAPKLLFQRLGHFFEPIGLCADKPVLGRLNKLSLVLPHGRILECPHLPVRPFQRPAVRTLAGQRRAVDKSVALFDSKFSLKVSYRDAWLSCPTPPDPPADRKPKARPCRLRHGPQAGPPAPCGPDPWHSGQAPASFRNR